MGKSLQTKTKKLLKKHNLWALGLMLAAVFLSLVYLHQFSYNSDDVAEQTITHYVAENGLRDTWLPPDPWLLKFPLYIAGEILSLNSRASILLTSIIMNSILVICVYIAAKYFFEKLKIKSAQLTNWLPLIWIFTLAPGFVAFLRMPNTRNMELGIMLITIVIALKFYYREINFKAGKLLLFVLSTLLFTAVNIYSDPFFLVFYAAFLGTFFFAEFMAGKINWEKARSVCLHIFASLVAAVIIKKVLDSLGFHINEAPIKLVSLDELGEKLMLTGQGIVHIFQFILPVAETNLLRAPVQILSISVACAALTAVVYGLYASRKSPIKFAIIAQIPIIIAAFIIQDSVQDIGSSRYLILLPIYLAVAAAIIAVDIKKYRKIYLYVASVILAINFIGLVIGSAKVVLGDNPLKASTSNTFQVGSESSSELAEPRNLREKKIIHELEVRDLQKGYGHYWDALIISHLSEYKINVGQVLCDTEGRIRPYYWVVQDEIFDPDPQTKSFIIFTSKNINHLGCNLSALGPDTELITIDNQTVIFVYGYDIASTFPAKETLSKPD